MAMPKSITKINKDGVKFVSEVDAVQYTITELSKAALRDVAKYLRKQVRDSTTKRTGNLRKSIATWVRINKETGTPELQIGVYSKAKAKEKGLNYAFYARYLEFGTKKQRAMNGGSGFLRNKVKSETDMIRKIQAQYLSGIKDGATTKIEEGEYIDDDVGI